MTDETNGRLWLHRIGLDRMVAEASSKVPLETGGILIGYFSVPDGVPVVFLTTGPGPAALHSRFGYAPDNAHDAQKIAEAYEASGGLLTYLGDWHTHPLPRSGLSRKDKRVMRRIARSKTARLPSPNMLILYFDGQWEIAAWQGRLGSSWRWNRRLQLTQLAVHVFDNE